jgi:hypothetical protein
MNRSRVFVRIYLDYPRNDIRSDLNVYEKAFLTWLDESPLANLSYTQEVFHSMIPLVNDQSFRTFQRMLKKLKEMGIIEVTVKNNLSDIELITLDRNKLKTQEKRHIDTSQCQCNKINNPLCINA